MDPSEKGEIISCLAGLFSNKNKFLGVIGIDLSISNILTKFAPSYPNRDMNSFIMDTNGALIAVHKKQRAHFSLSEKVPFNLLKSKDREVKQLGKNF